MIVATYIDILHKSYKHLFATIGYNKVKKMVSNQFKTVILLGLLTALLLFVGNMVGGYQGLIFAGIFVVLMNLVSFWFSDKIVLAMYRAKEIDESKNPRLYRIVREVVQLAKIPMPKVYIVPSANPNAFATGRGPKKSAVAATQGILDLLDDNELKGVIAHEVAHIKNRDVLIQTVAGMIAGVIGYVGAMARWSAIFGFGGRGDDRGNNIVSLLVLAIITPIIAMIIQLAISRSREYLADATGAKIIHSGIGLASALEKLEGGIKRNPMRMGNSSTAHLFIANPFRGGGMMNLLMTHPPMQNRIKKLRRMTF
jgi:heat shock protein HtpX